MKVGSTRCTDLQSTFSSQSLYRISCPLIARRTNTLLTTFVVNVALLQQLPPTSLCIHGSRESTLDLSHAVEFLSCTQSCTRNYELFLHEIFSYKIFSIAIYGIISLHISLHYSQSSLATLKLGVASSRVALQLWPLSLHGWIGCCHM